MLAEKKAIRIHNSKKYMASSKCSKGI